MHENLAVGDVLSADDGALSFAVLEIAGEEVVCRAQCDGTLRSRKGISLPSSARAGIVTDRDREIIEFAREKGVDFVGVSFVSSAHHVERVRALTGKRGPRIIAKIESQDGLDNVEEIADAADGLLVDRGDLSVHTSLETLIVSQKRQWRVFKPIHLPAHVIAEWNPEVFVKPVVGRQELRLIAAVPFANDLCVIAYLFQLPGNG